MKRIALLSLLLALALPARSDEMVAGKVVEVSDGDTVTVKAGKETIKVRLHGVDAPEKKQLGGPQAAAFTASLVLKQTVRLDVKAKDRYGRTVGVLYVGDKDVNAALVYAGYAWAYRQYSKDYVDREENARRNKRGLWADPVAPWEYRKAVKARASETLP